METIILFEAFIDETQSLTCTVSDLGLTDREWRKLSKIDKEMILTDYMKTEQMPHSWSARLIETLN